MQAFPQPPRNPCTGGMGEEGASNPPCKAPLNHCVPPGHRQRHCIPAGRRQDQGPPEAPPEKSPARHQQNTQTQGIIVSPRGIARDTVSPRGVGRTKAPPKHRQKSPPRGTGRTRKPKAPTKGNYDRSPANRFDFTCEISSVTRRQCVLQGVLRCPTLHFDVPGSLGQRVLHGVLRCPALSCI